MWGWQPARPHCPPCATQTRCPGTLSLLPPTLGCLEKGQGTTGFVHLLPCPVTAWWEVPLLSQQAGGAARGPAPGWGSFAAALWAEDLAWAHLTPNPLRGVWEVLATPGEMWNELGPDPSQDNTGAEALSWLEQLRAQVGPTT